MTTATITTEDLAALANTPAMQQAREQAAAQRLARRRAAADEIERLTTELDRLVPAADKVIVKAAAAVEAARQRVLDAEAKAREAHAARSAICNPREHRIGQLRSELRRDPCPAVDAFLSRLAKAEDDHREAMRSRPQTYSLPDTPEALERAGRGDEAAAERRRIIDARKAAMDSRARLEAFRAARVAADALREAALSDSELDTALHRIGATVGLP